MLRWLTIVCAALVLGGCVEETDASLRGEHAGAPVPVTDAAAAPAAAVERLSARLSEYTIELSATEVRAGTLVVELHNDGEEPHALEIAGAGQEWHSDALQPGETLMLSLVLEPGSYQVFCPLQSGGESHADRGMYTALRAR